MGVAYENDVMMAGGEEFKVGGIHDVRWKKTHFDKKKRFCLH